MMFTIVTIAVNLTGCASSSKVTASNQGAFTRYSELKGFCKGGCLVGFTEDNTGDVWIYNQNGIAKFDKTKIDKLALNEIFTSNSINSIVKDSYGNIWIATENEVCRFNGKDWKKFSIADGFTNKTVKSILVDDKGVLWFNTIKHGVYKYEKEHFVKFTLGGVDDIDYLRFIGKDKQALQWFLSSDKDIFKLDGNHLVLVAKDAIPPTFFGEPTANSILKVTKNNNLLLALSGKVYRVDKEGLKQIPGIDVESIFSDQKITCLLEDSQGALWVGHGALVSVFNKAGGFYRVVGDKVEHVDAESKNTLIYKIYEDSKGQLWFVAIQGAGSSLVQHYENNAWKTIYAGDFGDSVENLFEDSRHNYWFNVSPGGEFIHYRPQ